jgi:hypothetical protein
VPATGKQIWLTAAAVLAAGHCFAERIDPEIGRQIAAVQAIDKHAHPVLAPPLDVSDREFDALPVSEIFPAWPPAGCARKPHGRRDAPQNGASPKSFQG